MIPVTYAWGVRESGTGSDGFRRLVPASRYGLPMLLLLLSVAAAGDCVVDRLETRVTFGDGIVSREDRWTLGAEPGATDCRLLALPAPEGMWASGVEGRITRPDRRNVRFGTERLELAPGPSWSAPAARVHLPDADIGSTVELRVQWVGRQEGTSWSPGALGAVGVASLELEGGVARTASGLLSGGPTWSWASVPADQPPLFLAPDGASSPLPPTPAPEPWSLGRLHTDVALARSGSGHPLTLAAPEGVVDAVTLARIGAGTIRFGGASEDDAAPGPGCFRNTEVWECAVDPAGGPWQVPPGPSGPVHAVVPRQSSMLEFVFDDEQEGGPDEPPTGSLRVSGEWLGDAQEAPDFVVAPADAEALACGTGDVPGEVDVRTCLVPEGTGARWWSWRLPSVPVSGALPLVSGTAGVGTVAVEAAGGVVVVNVDGMEGERQRARPRALADGPGVRPVEEAWASWRVVRVAARDVLPDRDAVIGRIALLGIHASLPEPGLPLRFKNRLSADGALEEVVSLVRRRVRAAPAFERGPLSPRPLVRVLRVGWGTAWEQALLLARYLRQLKIDAVPMPVRPRSAGPGDPASPDGYRAAVVRVVEEGRVRWVVPACVLCGLDEIPADLHEAPVLSAEATVLPVSSPGAVYVVDGPGGGSRVTLEGAAARQLRERLLSLRPADRLAAVPGLVGAPSASLVRHEGLADAGGTVLLELDGPARGPALPEVALQGSSEVVLPWAGTWSWSPPPPSLVGVGRHGPDLSWSTEGHTTTLRIGQPVLSRRDAALGLTRVARALRR